MKLRYIVPIKAIRVREEYLFPLGQFLMSYPKYVLRRDAEHKESR